MYKEGACFLNCAGQCSTRWRGSTLFSTSWQCFYNGCPKCWMRIIVGVKLAMRYSKSLFSEKGGSLTRYRLVSKKKAYARLSSSTTTHAPCALLFKLIPKKYHFHADSQFFFTSWFEIQMAFSEPDVSKYTKKWTLLKITYWVQWIWFHRFKQRVHNSLHRAHSFVPPIPSLQHTDGW